MPENHSRSIGSISHCILCGAEIVIDSANRKYCSECMHKIRYKRQTDWIKKTYDRVECKLAVGEKTKFAKHAESRNESLNQFITRAMYNQLDLDIKDGDANNE